MLKKLGTEGRGLSPGQGSQSRQRERKGGRAAWVWQESQVSQGSEGLRRLGGSLPAQPQPSVLPAPAPALHAGVPAGPLLVPGWGWGPSALAAGPWGRLPGGVEGCSALLGQLLLQPHPGQGAA